MEELPKFKYHPDPIETGMIKPSTATCPCCGKARGYVYAKTPYGVNTIEHLCPWCIADGSAAAKFDVEFSDSYPLLENNIPPDVIDEVTTRTPGYISWQQDNWLSCCGDACEFHGDATKQDLASMTSEVRVTFMTDQGLNDDQMREFLRYYKPGGSPAIYKFRCRHCGKIRLGMDCD